MCEASEARRVRGMGLFSSEALQKVYNETVLPELELDKNSDKYHNVIGVGAITESGVKAAIIYHRVVTVPGFNLKGEWQIEGAFHYDWIGSHDIETRVLFKL